jgi:aminopeptidase
MDTNTLIDTATTHVRDIVYTALEHDDTAHQALVIFDTENGLTNILTAAYRRALPHATYIDFGTVTKAEVIAACDAREPGDLVVLIQSSNFRLDEFRIRLHLFQHKLKVIEHLHLYRNTEDSWPTYIEALAYDPAWYRTTGHALQAALTDIQTLRIEGMGSTLTLTGGLEYPKLNIGDYTGMENIGGTFPIGEVFTENKDLTQVTGSLMLYAFAGPDFSINMHEPFRVDITNGLVVGWDASAPQSFRDIVTLVESYERPILREIGFGLNRAITRDRYLNDITAFERILGLHVSLGEKHSVYKKPGITTHKTKFHVDLFPVVDAVFADDTCIFENGRYLL